MSSDRTRLTTEAERARLKAATGRALREAGGAECVQHATRVQHPALSKYASAGDEFSGRFMPLDIALEVDRASGKPVILATLAALQGYELRPFGESEDAPRADWSALLAGVTRETAEASVALLEALADGKIDTRERKHCLIEVEEASHALLRLQKRLADSGDSR
ncbi:phage regulatory CII family protein [Afifella aestuarii]|uniref:phage regulatory CII family protein n=1 Tax=Afifella aestuarii TaxID=1909496 RepID=UPI000FE41AFE|nr:phage regulatory CII family protein [Afifella aestuarii]